MLVHAAKYRTEDQIKNSDNTQKHTSEKSNNAKHSKPKLPWFSRLLRHSVRNEISLFYNTAEPSRGNSCRVGCWWQAVTRAKLFVRIFHSLNWLIVTGILYLSLSIYTTSLKKPDKFLMGRPSQNYGVSLKYGVTEFTCNCSPT